MNQISKKLLFPFFFAFFTLFLFFPKSVFGECTWGCKHNFEEDDCKRWGFWICGCKTSDYLFEINTHICYEHLKEIRICQSDGSWLTIPCPSGCKDSFTCNDQINDQIVSSNKLNLDAPSGFKSLGKLEIDYSISTIIGLIYIISSITFFFILTFGGLKLITSSGDEKKLAAARSQITHAFIGLAITFSTWAITNLLGKVFGFTINNFHFIKSFYQPINTTP